MVSGKSVKESSIDFKGEFGPVFFTYGCNFRCKFCHNPEMLEYKDEKLDSELEDLRIKAKSGWYSGVCITGGEPTLHPDLQGFIEEIKKLGLKVKLDTNGSNPSLLKKLIEKKLVDYIAVDVKAPPELYKDITGFSELEKIEDSVNLLSGLPEDKYEFRTTLAPVLRRDKVSWMSESEAERMASWILQVAENNKSRWFVQEFISRVKGEIADDELSTDKLPKNMHRTPQNVLESIRDSIRKYFPNCEIR
jgi:pyruvate formate lyase activating enzyme